MQSTADSIAENSRVEGTTSNAEDRVEGPALGADQEADAAEVCLCSNTAGGEVY